MNKASLLSGLLGGLAVAVVGAILLATGVIDTGDDGGTRVVTQIPDGPPSNEEAGENEGGKTVSEIYDQDAPGVAFIQAQQGGGGLTQGGDATGSGFVLDRDGYMLTNAHVIEGADSVQVSFDDNSGELIDARIVGSDPSTDLALLKVDPREAELRPLRLGDSEQVRVGDSVVAIGNPFGFSRTVTTGIISAKQRRITAPNGFDIDNVLQTDAAINPGNSGGPLLDARGRVIGINSQIATGGSRGSVGIGFAVPVNTARTVIQGLRDDGRIDRAYVGITSAQVTDDIARRLDLPSSDGALVQDVVPGGPADRAGLRGAENPVEGQISRGGDFIVELDGREVANPNDIAAAIADNQPGDRVSVRYLRDGRPRDATITLGKRPAQVPGQPTPESGGPGGGVVPLP